jgi:hypothetical protein
MGRKMLWNERIEGQRRMENVCKGPVDFLSSFHLLCNGDYGRAVNLMGV